jgi:hypothetical protein
MVRTVQRARGVSKRADGADQGVGPALAQTPEHGIPEFDR